MEYELDNKIRAILSSYDDKLNPKYNGQVIGYIEELEVENKQYREALETICNVTSKGIKDCELKNKIKSCQKAICVSRIGCHHFKTANKALKGGE